MIKAPDLVGNELEVGDKVAVIKRGERRLVVSTVMKITRYRVQVADPDNLKNEGYFHRYSKDLVKL